MKWIHIPSSANHEVYELLENDQKILSLFYNPLTGTARIDCFHEKRVFVMQKERFKKSRTIIRNEYGIKMGLVEEDKLSPGNGIIEFNENQYHYLLNSLPVPEYILYKESMEQPVTSFQIILQNNFTGLNIAGNILYTPAVYASLLMAVCWYKDMYKANYYLEALA